MVERDQIRGWLATNDAIRSACDLDLLRFFTRHSHVLLTTEQIANFVGYSQDAIDAALEHLLAGGYVTRLKGHAADADLYIIAGGGGSDRASLSSLSSLLELAATREGRLAIIDVLPKPPRRSGGASTADAEFSTPGPAENGGGRE